jgi:hypothetical protein
MDGFILINDAAYHYWAAIPLSGNGKNSSMLFDLRCEFAEGRNPPSLI